MGCDCSLAAMLLLLLAAVCRGEVVGGAEIAAAAEIDAAGTGIGRYTAVSVPAPASAECCAAEVLACAAAAAEERTIAVEQAANVVGERQNVVDTTVVAAALVAPVTAVAVVPQQ